MLTTTETLTVKQQCLNGAINKCRNTACNNYNGTQLSYCNWLNCFEVKRCNNYKGGD